MPCIINQTHRELSIFPELNALSDGVLGRIKRRQGQKIILKNN